MTDPRAPEKVGTHVRVAASSVCHLLAGLSPMESEQGAGGHAVEYFLGIPVTAEGMARARRQLDAARDRHDPQVRAEFLTSIGIDPNRPRPPTVPLPPPRRLRWAYEAPRH
jgi:hypothetical protein